MQFSLERQKAKLSNLNLRREKHGDDNVLAADLSIIFDAANTILSEFDPALKSSLYRKPDASDSQGELPVSDAGHLPKLRFPKMGGIKWDALIVGAATTVHYGTDTDESNVVLDDCRVDKFIFDCKDGGTVAVRLRVACRPDPDDVAKLSALIDSEIEITLEPPQADEQQGGIES